MINLDKDERARAANFLRDKQKAIALEDIRDAGTDHALNQLKVHALEWAIELFESGVRFPYEQKARQ